MGIKWVWCGICAKYLTFGTYPTSTVGALNAPTNESTPTKKCLKKITLEEEEYCEVLDACEKRKKSFGT